MVTVPVLVRKRGRDRADVRCGSGADVQRRRPPRPLRVGSSHSIT